MFTFQFFFLRMSNFSQRDSSTFLEHQRELIYNFVIFLDIQENLFKAFEYFNPVNLTIESIRSKDHWRNSSPSRYAGGDPRSNQPKSHRRNSGYDDFRSNPNRLDRNSDPSQNHYNHHHHHDPSLNRKRNSAPSYQPNWKRNRPDHWKTKSSYQKKSNWIAQLDDELWDGPMVNPSPDCRRYRPHETFSRNGRRGANTKETSKNT